MKNATGFLFSDKRNMKFSNRFKIIRGRQNTSN